MAFLTDRTLATGVTLDDLIHIVITGDTSQGNSAGSSYKATIGQVLSNVVFPNDYWTSGSTGTDSIKAVNSSGLDATGDRAVAWGEGTLASGQNSTAYGYNTIATGTSAHAEGVSTTAIGDYSHSEGAYTISSGISSHAEGYLTSALGDYSHAEGGGTTADGTNSHAEGDTTTAIGVASHSEGQSTTAIGSQSHAEGSGTKSIGIASHAEGALTTASGNYSHSEGNQTNATGFASHTEGTQTSTSGASSHAEGSFTTTSGDSAHAEGTLTIAGGDYSHAEGESTSAFGLNSHSEGTLTIANGTASHAEGNLTIANGNNSHSGGFNSRAEGTDSFIHSSGSLVSGDRSVVIGGQNITGTTDDTVYVPYLNISLLGTGTSINNLGIDVNGFIVTGTTGGFSGGIVTGETIFTGGISATTISATTIGSSTDCVDDLYVSNIHSCSPLNINPLDEGNVYFGSNSGITIDLANKRLGVGTDVPTEKLDISGKTKTINFQMTSGATSGYVLTSDGSGNASWQLPVVSADTNFANTNLTFTGSRDHDTNGNNFILTTDGGMYGESWIDFRPFYNTQGFGSYFRYYTNSAISDYSNNQRRTDIFANSMVINQNQLDFDFLVSTTGSSYMFFVDASQNKIGINQPTPTTELDVSGKTKTINFQMTSGATNGYVLTSDVSGNASWQAPTGGGVSIDSYYTAPSNSVITWDVSGNSTNYQTVLTANTTLNLSNVRNGDYGTIIVQQDGVGSRTITFGTINGAGGTHRVANGGGGSPILTSNVNAIDILTFTYNGSVMYWTVGNDYT